jgi:hypothetical protein
LLSTTVFRGGIAEIAGAELDKYSRQGPLNYKLLSVNEAKEADFTCDAKAKPAVYAGTLRFGIASDQAPGEYHVLVCSSTGSSVAIVGPLWVRALPLRISAVDPPVVKPNPTYEFTIFGEGFNSNPADNAILIETSEGPTLFAEPGTKIFNPPCVEGSRTPNPTCKVHFKVASDGGALTVSGIPTDSVAGRRRFRILAGHNVISNWAEVRFASPYDNTKSTAVKVALSIAFLLIPVLCTLVLSNVVARWRGGTWISRLVMDEASNRYSLSRIQLYGWMWVCFLGLTANTFRVGVVATAIPDGLFALSLLSIATAVASSAISRFRSVGGSAQVVPAASDLISDYGLIVWERVLFVACTTGSLVYTAWVVIVNTDSTSSDPVDIPIWLVFMNGLSALVYLLGKYVRASGPRVSQVFAEQSSLTLTITGANLSHDATFGVNGKLLSPQVIGVNASGEHKAEVLLEQYGHPGYANVIRLVIPSPLASWLHPSTLSIRNPNGQQALCRYDLAIAITSIAPEIITPAGRLTIKGHGFREGARVEIATPRSGPVLDCKILDIQGSAMEVAMPPNIEPGPGVLSISNADGTNASTNVAVRSKSRRDVDDQVTVPFAAPVPNG